MNLYEKLNRLDDSLVESKRVVKKKKLTESTNRVKLEVKYETYGRYGDGGDIKTGRVSGSTEVEALMKMLDHVHMYTDSDYAEEFKEENGRYPTTEEVTDKLYEQNGDGCDLIYWIRNLTTGEMIFDGAVEESEPEEWDDDIDEMLTENHKEYEVCMDSGISDEDEFFTDIRNAKRFAKDLVKKYGKLDHDAPAIIKRSNGDPLPDNWPVLYTVKYDSNNDSFKVFNSYGVEEKLTESAEDDKKKLFDAAASVKCKLDDDTIEYAMYDVDDFIENELVYCGELLLSECPDMLFWRYVSDENFGSYCAVYESDEDFADAFYQISHDRVYDITDEVNGDYDYDDDMDEMLTENSARDLLQKQNPDLDFNRKEAVRKIEAELISAFPYLKNNYNLATILDFIYEAKVRENMSAGDKIRRTLQQTPAVDAPKKQIADVAASAREKLKHSFSELDI